ncbi:BppU family phage baseplate upper protein, partial [Enterococcus devriesei]|uniref:BppU family phage baseplate upper protein n=1 Tax=Enterococcus devriesei TaxID=319970 RepID=UPI0028EDA7BB
MTIRKVADIIIRASPGGHSTVSGSGIKFYSYDKNSAAIDFHIQDQDGSPTDLLNVDVKLMLLTKESNEWKKFTAFDGPEIISEM